MVQITTSKMKIVFMFGESFLYKVSSQMDFHLESKTSGIGEGFQGTLLQAIARAKAMLLSTTGPDYLGCVVVWGGKRCDTRMAEVRLWNGQIMVWEKADD